MQHKTLWLVCLFALSTVVNSQPLMSSKRLKNIETPILRLGDGYLSYDRMSVGESALRLDQTKVSYGNVQSAINLNQTIDHNKVAKDLNIDFSASGGWGMFSASALVDYLHYIENTQYTENFTFTEHYYSNMLLDIANLPADVTAFNDVANNVYKKNGLKAFTDRYGDTFITQIPMGAMLIVNLKFNFVSAIDKQKFDANLSGGFGSIFNANLTIKNLIASSKAKGLIEVSAYQLGGDPSELSNIFAKKTDGGYYITSCDLDHWQDCQGAIDAIINYAQINFSKQIKPSNVGEKPVGNLVVVGPPFLNTYSSKFLIASPRPLDQTILESRFALAKLYNDIQIKKIFFDHFIASPAASYFTPGAYKLIKDIQSSLDWNLSLFSQFSAISCYLPGEEAKCPKIAADIQQYSKPLDQQAISYYQDNGFVSLSTCNFIPVSLPQDEEPIYVNYCKGQWITGSFIFKMAADKNTLSLKADYISPTSGDHLLAESALSQQGSYQNYSGVTSFHNLNTGDRYRLYTSIRLTRNNV